MRGKIKKIYRVECNSPALQCRRIVEAEETNFNLAAKAFRGIGWGTQKGFWYCSSCKRAARKKSARNMRANERICE